MIEINGMSISYLEAGAGEPLLLLHGVGHSSTAWLRAIPALARKYRVLAPDMPGHGRSASPDAPYDSPFFARFALDFLNGFALGRVQAAGNSLGGLAAMLAALEKPSMFSRLILADPLGFTKAPMPPLDDALLGVIGLWLSFPRTRAMIRAGYASAFFDAKNLDEESVDEIAGRMTDQARMDAARRAVRAIFHDSKHLEALHQQLADLAPPVLVIWGKNDPVLPSKDAAIARRVLPAPRIEVLERCGHLPHIERFETFCELALSFLTAA